MAEHSQEINYFLIWAVLALGSAFVGLSVWSVKRLIAQLDGMRTGFSAELSGIRAEVKQTNATLGAIERDLRGDLADLDRRMARVELRCDIEHGKGHAH